MQNNFFPFVLLDVWSTVSRNANLYLNFHIFLSLSLWPSGNAWKRGNVVLTDPRERGMDINGSGYVSEIDIAERSYKELVLCICYKAAAGAAGMQPRTFSLRQEAKGMLCNYYRYFLTSPIIYILFSFSN